LNAQTKIVLPDTVALEPAEPVRARPAAPRWKLLAFLRKHPAIAIGGGILAVVAFLAVFAPWLGTFDPRSLDPAQRLRPPSAQHWFGTDMLGRDLYSRVIYGARISLMVGFSCAFLASVIGVMLGLLSASWRWVDSVMMRVMDGLMSIPSMLLAIALMAISPPAVSTVIIAITIVEVPRIARVIRGVLLSVREQPFVEAAIAAGATMPRLIVKHLLPATFSALSVQAAFAWAAAMIIEASLSFIGAGTPPTIPSWGNIMADSKALWQVKPHLVFIPAAFLSATVLAVNLLGDGLRDALDPRMGERV
jgi:peptide/nickel transport system permease protein